MVQTVVRHIVLMPLEYIKMPQNDGIKGIKQKLYNIAKPLRVTGTIISLYTHIYILEILYHAGLVLHTMKQFCTTCWI